MTNFGDPMRPDPQPGYYRASDGNDYPIPPGQYLASDGQLYPLAAQPTHQAPPPLPPTGPATFTGAPPAVQPSATPWVWNAPSILILAGAGAVFVGAFLPWASVGPFSVSGTDGDGVLTLILALVAGVIGVFALRKSSVGLAIGSLVAAGLSFAIAAYDIANINSVGDNDFFEASVGGGLYLTALGALAGIVGAALLIATARPKTSV